MIKKKVARNWSPLSLRGKFKRHRIKKKKVARNWSPLSLRGKLKRHRIDKKKRLRGIGHLLSLRGKFSKKQRIDKKKKKVARKLVFPFNRDGAGLVAEKSGVC